MSAGVSETVSSLTTMRDRRVLLLAGICGLVTWGTVTDLAAGHLEALRAGWQIGSGLAFLIVAIVHRKGKVRWPWLCPLLVSLVVAVGPFSVSRVGGSSVSEVPVALAPIIIGLLFFERPEIVIAALVSGFLATTAWWWGSPALVENAVTLAVGSSTLLITCLWVGSLRREERTRNEALRIAETRRAHADQLTLVGRLAAGVAHEINNPLAFVKANLGSVTQELGGGTGELREVLEETHEGVDRIREIVADLRSFARDGAAGVDTVELKDVVDATVRMAAVLRPRGLPVTAEIPKGLAVRASRRHLAQAVLNLLMNAGDALERGQVKPPRVRIQVEAMASAVRLSIEDNGPGLSQDVASHLFEPFFSTKPEGTGLGLVLAREYLATFDATLGGENGPQGGARFVIVIPVIPNTGEYSVSPGAEAPVARRGLLPA